MGEWSKPTSEYCLCKDTDNVSKDFSQTNNDARAQQQIQVVRVRVGKRSAESGRVNAQKKLHLFTSRSS